MDVVTILRLRVSVGRGLCAVFARSVGAGSLPRLRPLVLHLLELHGVVQLDLALMVLAVACVLLLHRLDVVHLLVVRVAGRGVHGVLIGCRPASCCARSAAGTKLTLDTWRLLLLLTTAAEEGHRLRMQRLLVLDAVGPVTVIAAGHIAPRAKALVLADLARILPVGGQLRL